MAARGSAKGQQYALGDVTRDGSIAPTNEPARAGGEHASRSAHFDEVDARSSVTVKKKRSAETALLMLGGCIPICV